MSRTLFALVIVVLACPAVSQAAAPPRATQMRFLSLREAITIALKKKPANQNATPEQQRELNQLLLNVEVAYWNLYGSYWSLYSREQGLNLATETYKLVQARYDAGRVNIGDLHQARGQYQLFRAQRLNAIDTLRENEHQLRLLMGLSGYGSEVFLPIDAPKLAASKPDWNAAIKETMKNRPELQIARREVAASQTELMNNKQSIQVKLSLASAMETLKDTELKAESFLGLQFRRIHTSHEQIRANRAQREAFGEQLVIRKQDVDAGRATLDILLEAQRFWADAMNNEYQQIVAYNNAHAGFDFAKGASAARHGLVSKSEPARDLDLERRLTQKRVSRLPEVSSRFLEPGAKSGEDEKAHSFAAVWKGFTPAQTAAFRAEW